LNFVSLNCQPPYVSNTGGMGVESGDGNEAHTRPH